MGRSTDTRIVRVGQNALAPSLPVPNGPVPRVGQAYPAVGQMSIGCPTFPSSMKYLSETTASLAPGASETLEFTTPGAFCPVKMILTASVDVNDVEVVHIISGLEDQIITGEVPGGLFSIANNCCPVACLKCLCSPGVPLRVTVTNDDAMAQTVTVTLVGAYLDACPPNGAPYDLPVIPGCPYPGSDKLVGFDVTVPVSGSASVEITTPGKFCPRALFLSSASLADITIVSIKSGLKDQIISGELPASLFGIDNECCILACFDCLCAPGYPLTLTFANSDGEAVVRGALIGTYTDACP
jgi:hypothetical protein